MKKAILKTGVACLKIAYAPIRKGRVRDRITFISRQSDVPSMDIRMLADKLAEKHPEIDCRVLARKLKMSPAGVLSYTGHMLKQMRALATSKVVVLDGYCISACVLDHKPETKVVQIWHALTAIKQFGYQTISKPSGHSRDVAEVMQMHRRYDHVVCSGEETGKLFSRGMNLKEEQLVFLGLPRIDEILREEDCLCAEMREEFGIYPEKKIALYVPTFRKGGTVKVRELAEALDKDRYQLVVRLHPVYEEDGEIPEGVINGGRYSSYDWLKACDAVITDYSALGLEAALTGKPVYFYTYDIEEYEAQVGLNIDPAKEMPQATSSDAEELAGMMKEEYDYLKLREFRDKYISVDTEDCTGKLADYLVSLMN
jgi:Putative glycosyl/glycerophosphate transferases involved in teichoic acid biosynthesis TagF/TagB/EpsJ/RodC